jgi:hypothetical protein
LPASDRNASDVSVSEAANQSASKAQVRCSLAPATSWLVYFGACILLGIAVMSFLQRNGVRSGKGGYYLIFGSYWASGRAAAHGLNPYAGYPLTFRYHLTASPREFVDLNLNTPCLLPLFQALSHFSIGTFIVVWMLGSFLLFVIGAGLLLRRYPRMQNRQILWLLLATSVFETLGGGHVYALLFFIATVAWIALSDGYEIRGALLIGLLVAIKPNVIVWPIFLYLAGCRRLALRSLFVALAASALPAFLYGPRIYSEWLAALRDDPHWIFTTDISIMAFFSRLGLHTVGAAIAALVALVLACLIWKTKAGLLVTSGVALCASILCSPLAWFDYTLLPAPMFVARRWTRLGTVAAVLLAIPTALPLAMAAGSRLVVMLGGMIYLVPVWIMLGEFWAGMREPRTLPAGPERSPA